MDNSVGLFAVTSPQFRPRMIPYSVSLGTFEVQRVTAPAVAAATQADYFVLSNIDGETAAVWLDIDADGTVPTGAAYVAADYQIEVNVATGDDATVVAAAIVLAMSTTFPKITITDNVNGTIDFTSTVTGNVAAPARHNADDSGNGSFVVATQTAGVAAALGAGKFDGNLAHTAAGVYVITFDQPYVRVPECGILTITDNRVGRVSAVDVFSITIDIQNLSGGASIDGAFSLIVLGSDAKDAVEMN